MKNTPSRRSYLALDVAVLIVCGALFFFHLQFISLGNVIVQPVGITLSLKFFDLTATDVKTISVVAILFHIFWRVTGPVLWEPYLSLITAREQATVGAQEHARGNRERAGKLTEEFESKMLAARVEAMKEKLEFVSRSKKEAAKIVAEAEKKAAEKLAAGRSEMMSRVTRVREDLFRDLDGTARALAERIKTSSGAGAAAR